MAATGITHEFGHQISYYLGEQIGPEYEKRSDGTQYLTYITGASTTQQDEILEVWSDYYRTDVYSTDPAHTYKNPVTGDTIGWNTAIKQASIERSFFRKFFSEKFPETAEF